MNLCLEIFCGYIYMYIYICVCIYTHTHTHTHTFNFLFSSILILLMYSEVLVLKACVDPMYISLHSLHSIM